MRMFSVGWLGLCHSVQQFRSNDRRVLLTHSHAINQSKNVLQTAIRFIVKSYPALNNGRQTERNYSTFLQVPGSLDCVQVKSQRPRGQHVKRHIHLSLQFHQLSRTNYNKVISFSAVSMFVISRRKLVFYCGLFGIKLPGGTKRKLVFYCDYQPK